MINENMPFVGYLQTLPRTYEVRLITRESNGPLARILGTHTVESHAVGACKALESTLGVQNAGQLHSSGLRPMPLPWVAKSA